MPETELETETQTVKAEAGAEKPDLKKAQSVLKKELKPTIKKEAPVQAPEKPAAPAVKELTEQQKEDLRRQELLNAARKTELTIEGASPAYNDNNDNGQYYAQDPQNNYYDPNARYMGEAQYGQGYGGQYVQNGYGQGGYNDYQYADQYGYDNGQQYTYYEPVPSAPQYNREQFGNAQYNMQYNTSYDQYGGTSYNQYQNQGMSLNSQIQQNFDNIDMDDDDDFEFEFINMGDN